jgi:hypothetical protein
VIHHGTDVLMALLMDKRRKQFDQRAIDRGGAVERDAVELTAIGINELVGAVKPIAPFLVL